MSRTETIKTLYEAFGRGDVAAIVARVSDDVDWNNDRVASKECPWNGNFKGKDNVPGFFKAVGENLDLGTFVPHTFVEGGDHVVVMLTIAGHVRRNGQPWQNEAVHFWTFDARGRISAYRHFNDTAAELAAWRG